MSRAANGSGGGTGEEASGSAGERTVTFDAGLNIAMKIPGDAYEATVRFYRDVLGFDLEERDTTETPTIARSCTLRFGPVTLWLDRVDTYPRSDVWLELRTDDLAAAMATLAAAGIRRCDEVEPLDPSLAGHWIKNPAGVVHLLVEDPGEPRPGELTGVGG